MKITEDRDYWRTFVARPLVLVYLGIKGRGAEKLNFYTRTPTHFSVPFRFMFRCDQNRCLGSTQFYGKFVVDIFVRHSNVRWTIQYDQNNVSKIILKVPLQRSRKTLISTFVIIIITRKRAITKALQLKGHPTSCQSISRIISIFWVFWIFLFENIVLSDVFGSSAWQPLPTSQRAYALNK